MDARARLRGIQNSACIQLWAKGSLCADADLDNEQKNVQPHSHKVRKSRESESVKAIR